MMSCLLFAVTSLYSLIFVYIFFFFFSSRRRHTRLQGDWSSDVCSSDLGLRRDLTRVIRRSRPDVVVCGDPTVRWYGSEYLNHPDHRAAASAALDAVFPSAETRAIFPELLTEGLEPHKVKEVFLSGAVPPDTWIDVGDTLALKCAALKAHVSQVGTGDWVDTLLMDWAVRDGKRAGVQYGEAYRRFVLRSGT